MSQPSEWSFRQLYENDDDGVKQDSAEWHVWRGKGLGSSDAPVLMYTSPWKTLHETWLEKTGLLVKKHTTNWAIERGKQYEPVARDIYNWENKCEMRPTTFVHSRYPFMRASMDGFSRRLGYGIEIKVPGKKDVAKAKRGEVPDKYYPQLQWLMSCSNSTEIDYCTLDYDHGGLLVTRVKLDREYERRMIAYARWFWFLVRNKIEPKMREAKIYAANSIGNKVPELSGQEIVFDRDQAQGKLKL